MTKYIEAIKRYEQARQIVNTLTENKRSLVSDCDNMKQGDDHHNWELRNPCLVVAWSWMQENNKGEAYYDQIKYGEIMLGAGDDFDIGTISGGICDKCRDAYAIKRGALADAKKEFGAAKRSLSAIGKQIIGAKNEL